jgi:hypothetical protein
MDAAAMEVRGAHDALLRSRSELLAQRDEIDGRLAQVESAITALRAILGEPDSESISSTPSVPPTASAPVAANGRVDAPETEPASATESVRSTPASRKARLREVMLEAHEDWLSVKDIATSVEGRESTETDRNAVYEILRRMTDQGEVERDSSSRPTRYRAKAPVLRERLLDDAS